MSAIAIGSDDIGYRMKEEIKRHLTSLGHDWEDFGVYSEEPADYPDIALAVAEAIRTGRHSRGILVCGTGIGMSIAASKVPGVRAALCHDTYSAERARKSNDAQILTMGARVIGPEPAKKIVEAWLASEFAGGASARKVDKIQQIDDKYHRKEAG